MKIKLTGKGSSYFVNVDLHYDYWEVTELSTDKVSVKIEPEGFLVTSETNEEFDDVLFSISTGETVTVYQKKYIYIKRNIKDSYIILYDELSSELYNNIGSSWSDYQNNKYVMLSDEQIAFYKANQKASIKEVFNCKLDTIKKSSRTIEDAKREMLRKIDVYDQSKSVNNFLLNGMDAWFTPSERNGYKLSVDSAKILGIETLQLFVNNILITIPTTSAEQLLAQIQLYADAAYLVTKQHKLNVETLTDIDAVDNYDYKVNYPPILNFEI